MPSSPLSRVVGERFATVSPIPASLGDQILFFEASGGTQTSSSEGLSDRPEVFSDSFANFSRGLRMDNLEALWICDEDHNACFVQSK